MRLNLTRDPFVISQSLDGRNAQVAGGTDYFGVPVFLLFLFKFYGDRGKRKIETRCQSCVCPLAPFLRFLTLHLGKAELLLEGFMFM